MQPYGNLTWSCKKQEEAPRGCTVRGGGDGSRERPQGIHEFQCRLPTSSTSLCSSQGGNPLRQQ